MSAQNFLWGPVFTVTFQNQILKAKIWHIFKVMPTFHFKKYGSFLWDKTLLILYLRTLKLQNWYCYRPSGTVHNIHRIHNWVAPLTVTLWYSAVYLPDTHNGLKFILKCKSFLHASVFSERKPKTYMLLSVGMIFHKYLSKKRGMKIQIVI